MSTFFSDWFYLSIRNIKQIWRPIMAVVSSLFIPIFFFIVNASSFKAIAQLPGFPAGSYMNFIAPTAMFSAIFFSVGNAGIELAMDMTGGYFKKLVIMPINRLAIILGKLSEVAVQSLMQGLIVMILLLLVGVRIETGFLGFLAIFLMLILFGMAWSCIGMIIALRTQNPRMVQSLFIVVFPLLYLTTSQMPKELLPKTYATIVSYNPVTYVIEAVRGLMIRGWDDPAIWQGFVVTLILFAVMILLTLLSFRKTVK